MQDFPNFVLHNCILIYDAEQVDLKLQLEAIDFKNKEVTANPKPKTLEKNCFLKTLNPKGPKP